MKQAPLFSALGKPEMESLLGACRIQDLPAGSQVFSPLERAERFYVILAGRVKVYKLSARGNEQILHLYGPGQTFGEAAMWAGISYPAFAAALVDTTLLVVSRSALRDLIERNADLALAMMAGMASKLREFNLLIEQLSLKEVPARLASVLLELSRQAGGSAVRLRQTKRELAAQIGTVAETLSRALKELKRAGLIEVNGAEITILDAGGLGVLAAG
jgi:CRP/FNR family transcriptional regulator